MKLEVKKNARKIQMLTKSAAFVRHLRVILESTNYVQHVNKHSIAVQIARSMTGKRNIKLSVKSYRRISKNDEQRKVICIFET